MVFVVDRRKALKRLKICWDDYCRWSLELLFAFETSLSKGIKKASQFSFAASEKE